MAAPLGPPPALDAWCVDAILRSGSSAAAFAEAARAAAAALTPGKSAVAADVAAPADDAAALVAACATLMCNAAAGGMDGTALMGAMSDAGIPTVRASTLASAFEEGRAGIADAVATRGAPIDRVSGIRWRADQLRRSTSGAAVNEPVLVLSLDTLGCLPAGGRGPEASRTSEALTMEAGPQEAAALLRSVTEALEAADRLVAPQSKASAAAAGRAK